VISPHLAAAIAVVTRGSADIAPAPLLESDCVAKRYDGRQVLSSASLRAVAGRVTALVGRNGAGKSTLLRITTGSIAPDSGYVRLRGSTLLTVTLPRLARHGVFFLPDRDLLHPGIPVGAQILAAAAAFNTPVDLPMLTDLLGISGCIALRPRTLSGGERRRAEIAVALARRPDILIADEPLRGLSPIDAETIMQALSTFARSGGAVIVTGHEIPLLMPAVDHVTWCTAGTTHEFESPALAMADFAFRRDFLP
jgi:lipopolysaccharide export system ATP-binding protein